MIESLPDDGLHTGRRLVDDSLIPATKTYHVGVFLWQARSRAAFLSALEQVALETAERPPPALKIYPILHIDAHGADDKSAVLISPTNEAVLWSDLADRCRKINVLCQNNLLITTGLCYGLLAITAVTMLEVTPFLAVVGPTEAVSAREVDLFASFYNELFRSGDATAACARLGEKFGIYLSERVLLKAYAEYVRENGKGKGFQARVERLITEVRQAQWKLSLKDIRRLVKTGARPSSALFEKLKNHFLMSGDPRNAGRFRSTFEDACALASTMAEGA